MSNKISKTILQYNTLEQLQEFAESQMTLITQLSKKVQKIEDERDHLKKLLESVPVTTNGNQAVQQFAEDDTEFICTMEIGKLKESSVIRELTFEESKRLNIYFDMLVKIKSSNKKDEKEVEKLSDNEILKLVEGNKDAK